MAVVREFAPAKVNLTLDVLGKRADGYHELQSLVAFACDVGDRLTLSPSAHVAVSVSGPFGPSIAGTNLIEATLQRIAAAAPGVQLGAVHLEKNLPVAAGIGGGSADAAAVIRAVQALNPDVEIDWHAIALRIGADVPVCVASRMSWMTGLGERVSPIAADWALALPALIVNPLVPVPADKTARVFRALGAPALLPGQPKVPPTGLKTSDHLIEFVMHGTNSLEGPACQLVPEIADVLNELAALDGCRLARMSGGGPTCFGLFGGLEGALAAKAVLATQRPDWWVVSTLLS